MLGKAKEIAVGQAMGTDEESRKISSELIRALIDQMVSLTNTKLGDRYLFSGSKTSTQPFSSVENPATIDNPVSARDNVYSGAVSQSGTYTGSVNKTYAVKINEGGTLAAATYQFSSDGGRTWNTVSDIANTSGGAVITAATLIKDITGYTAYSDTDYIHLEGTDTNGDSVSDDTFTLSATKTVGDLLTKIQDVFGNVTASITSDGKLMINTPGANPLAVQIGVKNLDGSADNTLQFDADGDLTMTMAGGVIDLGEGIALTFSDALFGENDVFYVDALAAGYYHGNNDQLSVTVNRGMSVACNISGAEAFTIGSEGTGVDVFKTLNDLKDALDNNDEDEISRQLENLKSAQGQILLSQSLCGIKANHIEMAKNSLDGLGQNLTSLLSDAQDVDVAEYATKLSMQEIALQASYALAAKIDKLTILNFLK